MLIIFLLHLDVTGDCSWSGACGWWRQQTTIIHFTREYSSVLQICREWLQRQRWFWLYCFESLRCHGYPLLVILVIFLLQNLNFCVVERNCLFFFCTEARNILVDCSSIYSPCTISVVSVVRIIVNGFSPSHDFQCIHSAADFQQEQFLYIYIQMDDLVNSCAWNRILCMFDQRKLYWYNRA